MTPIPNTRWPWIIPDDDRANAARAAWIKHNPALAHEIDPSRFPDCKRCPLSGDDGKPIQPVYGDGPARPLAIAVGMEPGAQEHRQGRSFVGPSGKLLWKAFDDVGVSRDAIWSTNTALCLPRPGANLDHARRCCWPRLKSELAQFPGVPIVALGAAPTQTLLGAYLSDETASPPKVDSVATNPPKPRHLEPDPVNLRGLLWKKPADIKITEVSGTLFDIDVDGTGFRPIIPTVHPAAILRGVGGDRGSDLLFVSLLYDVGKVVGLGQGKTVRWSDDVEIAFTGPHALLLLNSITDDIRRCKHGAIDTETDSLNARRAQMSAISLATVDRAVAMPYDVIPPDGWHQIRKVCADPEIAIGFHNMIYDLMVLERHGVPSVTNVFDTLLKHHSAFPGMSHYLQHVLCQFYAAPPWKSEFRSGQGTLRELLTYNARDALACARVDPILDDALDRTHSRKTYEVDRQCAEIAIQMQKNGLPIDRARNAELHKHFQQIIARTKAEIDGTVNDPEVRAEWIDRLAVIKARTRRKGEPPDFMSRHALRVRELRDGVRKKSDPTQCYAGKGPVVFNLNAPEHVAALIQACGHALPKLTKGGKPSTDKETLESMTHVSIIRTILEYREAFKLDSTFVCIPIEGPPNQRIGYLHSTWNVHRISGRWSASPAVMNWPKENKRGRPNLRSQVVAPSRRRLVGADASQLEARLIALQSGDPFLTAIFMDNFGDCPRDCDPKREPVKMCPIHDIHTVFADAVFGEQFWRWDASEQKEKRDLIKRAEYGAMYGGQVETLYSAIVKEFPYVTMDQVGRVLQIIKQKMPLIDAWHQWLVQQAAREGYVAEPIHGRRRVFPLGGSGYIDTSVIYNQPIQSAAAAVMNDAGIELKDRIDPKVDKIVNQVHDQYVVNTTRRRAEHVAEILTDCMSRTYTITNWQGREVTMFFPANAEIGQSWAEL